MAKGITDPMEAAKRPFNKKHTSRGEISHPWQVKSNDNKSAKSKALHGKASQIHKQVMKNI